MKIKCELYNDNFQNRKKYNIPRAQLVIADIPYNLGENAFASNPSWYVGGDNKKGESLKAGKQFFPSDKNFNLVEYMHFCSKLLIKEPKERGKAPAMIMFCSFEQMAPLIEVAKRYGFKNSYPLVFIKKTSAQALKANMRIVGATEYAVVFYRDKLPKFNNAWQQEETGKKMILNWFEWERDSVKEVPKVHPTQKHRIISSEKYPRRGRLVLYGRIYKKFTLRKFNLIKRRFPKKEVAFFNSDVNVDVICVQKKLPQKARAIR